MKCTKVKDIWSNSLQASILYANGSSSRTSGRNRNLPACCARNTLYQPVPFAKLKRNDRVRFGVSSPTFLGSSISALKIGSSRKAFSNVVPKVCCGNEPPDDDSKFNSCHHNVIRRRHRHDFSTGRVAERNVNHRRSGRETLAKGSFLAAAVSFAGLAVSAGVVHAKQPPAAATAAVTNQVATVTALDAKVEIPSGEKIRYGDQGRMSEADFKSGVSYWYPQNIAERCVAVVGYKLDVLMERHPSVSFVILALLTVTWVTFGACAWWFLARMGKKSTALGLKPTWANCMWAAWSCVASSSTHTKEIHKYGRGLALCLTIGGLVSYSVLTGTVSASLRSRYEDIKMGRESRAVLETDHIIVVGQNAHLGALLRQLDRARVYARRDDGAKGKQTVVLMAEEHSNSLQDFKPKCPELNVLVRNGDLSSKNTFKRAAAHKAAKVVMLANHDDGHTTEDDAQILASLLALTASIDQHPQNQNNPFNRQQVSRPTVTVEVSKQSSARLLRTVGDCEVEPVENMTNRLLAQCMRQSGLTKVYRKLMRHTGTIINLRSYPELVGLPVRAISRGMEDAVVIGVLRDNKPIFHPSFQETYLRNDKLMIIADKHSHRSPPDALVKLAEEFNAGNTDIKDEKIKLVVPEFGFRNDSVRENSRYEVFENGFEAKRSRSQSEQAAEEKWKTIHQGPLSERILLCGWRVGVAETCFELDHVVPKGCEMVILADTPIAERDNIIDRKIKSYGRSELTNLKVRHVVGNPCSRTDVRNALLLPTSTGIVPQTISIVVAGEEAMERFGVNMDKLSIFSALMAQDVCLEHNIQPRSLVAELVDRRLGQQVRKSHLNFGYISSMELMGLYISQVVEHPEMNYVWSELLRFAGDSIYIKDPRFYTWHGRETTFLDIVDAAKARGETAIGWRIKGKTHLNPRKDDVCLFNSVNDGVIVVASDRF